MARALRTRRTLHLPITLSVSLIVLNVSLMVCWIVLFARNTWWSALVLGTIVFALILVGLSLYMVILIKEVRLNQRQANFVDSVTHELKSPIAALRLYLETLSMRPLSDEQRAKFYHTMEGELQRLDRLITQLLEVGRLDAIGEQSEPEDFQLDQLLQTIAQAACAHHKCDAASTFAFDLEPILFHARPLVIETIFRNLLDNAIKYGGDPPKVEVQLRAMDRHRVVVRIYDNGCGVPVEDRRRIFRMFYRTGNELHRRRKGTGLGLYIVQTLVRQLNGRVAVHDHPHQSGSLFEVELPGRAVA